MLRSRRTHRRDLSQHPVRLSDCRCSLRMPAGHRMGMTQPPKGTARAPFARCKARNGRVGRRAGGWLAFTTAIPSAAFVRPISTSPHLSQVPESFTPSADMPSCHSPDISCRGSFLPESFRGGCSFGADTCCVGLFQRQSETMVHGIRGQATPEQGI